MSREKSEKDVRNVPITVRLNEEEHEKLKQCAAACGLSAAEFMRQLCKGNAPQPQPKIEFWELLNKLYEVHDALPYAAPCAFFVKVPGLVSPQRHTSIIIHEAAAKTLQAARNGGKLPDFKTLHTEYKELTEKNPAL